MPTHRRRAPLAVVAVLAVVLTACSSNNSATTTTTTSASRTTATTTTATTTTAASPTTSATLVPQSATETEFYSPTKNISCELDYNLGSSTEALCLTIKPPISVVLKTDGSLTECSGTQCLSNAGTNTPVLNYGTSVTLGPFTCRSATTGVTCTIASGAGYQISTAGVSPLGGATVANP